MATALPEFRALSLDSDAAEGSESKTSLHLGQLHTYELGRMIFGKEKLLPTNRGPFGDTHHYFYNRADKTIMLETEKGWYQVAPKNEEQPTTATFVSLPFVRGQPDHSFDMEKREAVFNSICNEQEFFVESFYLKEEDKAERFVCRYDDIEALTEEFAARRATADDLKSCISASVNLEGWHRLRSIGVTWPSKMGEAWSSRGTYSIHHYNRLGLDHPYLYMSVVMEGTEVVLSVTSEGCVIGYGPNYLAIAYEDAMKVLGTVAHYRHSHIENKLNLSEGDLESLSGTCHRKYDKECLELNYDRQYIACCNDERDCVSVTDYSVMN